MSKNNRIGKRCVGCEQRTDGNVRIEGLGEVCPLCMEVLPLVWEKELAEVREARAKVERFIRWLNRDGRNGNP